MKTQLRRPDSKGAPAVWRVQRSSLRDATLTAGLLLMLFPCLLAVVSVVGFAMGLPIGAVHVPVAAFLTALLAGEVAGVRDSRAQVHRFARAVAGTSLFVVACLWVAGRWNDLSYDGQAYHQSAVLMLARGWNPVRDPLSPALDSFHLLPAHYPKAAWIAAASVYKLTGHLEQGKGINLVLFGGAFLLVWSALLGRWPAHPVRTGLFALLVALNPVTLCQAFTFYVDGQLACCLTALVALGYLAFIQADRRIVLGVFAAIVLLVNLKFTGVLYAPLMLGVAVLALYRLHRAEAARSMLVAGAVALTVGVLGVGFNPYVTNQRGHSNPFYPLAGSSSFLPMGGQMPLGFETMNRFEKLASSLFSASANCQLGRVEWKLPFELRSGELATFYNPDTRVGGFGPLFGGCLLLATVLYLSLLARRRTGFQLPLLSAIVIGVLLNPESWWARYSPQLWLIPLAVLVGYQVVADPRGRATLFTSTVLLAAMVANTALVAHGYLSREFDGQRDYRAALMRLKARPQPLDVAVSDMESSLVRMADADLSVRLIPSSECHNAIQLAGTTTRICASAVAERRLVGKRPPDGR